MPCSAYTCLDVCKNHLLIFSSFLDIWENVEWPRFFGPPGIFSTKSKGLDGALFTLLTAVALVC